MITLIFLVPGPEFPAWQKEIIHQVYKLTNVQISALIWVDDDIKSNEGKNNSWLMKSLLSFFLDSKPIDPDAFSGIPKKALHSELFKMKFIHTIPEKWPPCDIVVNFVPWVDEKKIAKSTGALVWGYRFGNSTEITNPLTTYREILTFKPVTCLKIVAASPDHERLSILYQAMSTTILYSTRWNVNQVAWKAVECTQILLRSKRILLDLTTRPRPKEKFSPDNLNLSNTIRASKGNVTLSSLVRWTGVRIITNMRKATFRAQWVLAYAKVQSPFNRPDDFTAILPPNDRFWADPHLFPYKNKTYIFFEELFYSSNKGHISCAIMNDDGSFGPALPILEKNYHLSYPFVFEANNNIYMIPETATNRSIELYKCTIFPNKWKFIGNIMNNIIAHDTTVLNHDGFWWLFVNLSPVEGMSSYDQLHLYYSKKFPTDNWTPHPANPIIDNVCLSRPAGKIFEYDGKLFRPSQDSSGRYGKCLNLNEITNIDPENYRETLCWKWMPDDISKEIFAIHTFNYVNGFTFVDVQLNRFRWPVTKTIKMKYLK